MTREEQHSYASELREKARRCLWLAQATTDKRTRTELLALSEELTARADEIRAQVAQVLRDLREKQTET